MSNVILMVENALTSAEEQLASSAAIPQRKKKPILIITVDIGKGKSGDITVYAGDSNKDLAVDFCKQHELSDTLVGAIAKHIQQNVDALNKGKLKRVKDAAQAKKDREAAAAAKSSGGTSSSSSSLTMLFLRVKFEPGGGGLEGDGGISGTI